MAATLTWLRRTFGWSNSRQSWEERGGLALLLLGGLGVWYLGRRLSGVQQVAIWSLLLLTAAVLLRRGWLKLFGPVLFYDMLCLARRGRYFWIRCAYSFLLLLVFLPLWGEATFDRHITPQRLARLAEEFFYFFMLVQISAVSVLTPAYVAGAVADEKARKTLEFLLATDLRNREIVLSKLGSRLANLTLFTITGLPILSFLQFLGGVDPDLVLAGFAATGLTMLGLSGLSILLSVQCKRPRDAIALTYLTAITYVALSTTLYTLQKSGLGLIPSWPIWFGSNPPTVNDLVDIFNSGNLLIIVIEIIQSMVTGLLATKVYQLLGSFALFTTIVAGLCLVWSVLRLRAIALEQAQNKEETPGRGKRTWHYPPIGHFPMLWKEIFVEGGLRLHWFARVVMMVLVVLSLLPGMIMAWMYWVGPLFLGHGPGGHWDLVVEGQFWGLVILTIGLFLYLGGMLWPSAIRSLVMVMGVVFLMLIGLRICDHVLGLASMGGHQSSNDFAMSMNAWVRGAGTGVACLTLLAVAVRASSAISGEREKQTFDSLLTTPLDSNAILGAKWLGSIFSVRLGWVWLGLIWAFGLVSGGLHLLALPIVLAAWFIFAAVVAMIGLWFSMVCSTSMKATVCTLITTVMVGVGHWMVWFCCMPLFLLAGPGPGRSMEEVLKLHAGVTPPVQLGILAFCGEEFRHGGKEFSHFFLFSLLGLFFWSAVAVGVWAGLLVPRFRTLTGRQLQREPEKNVGLQDWSEDHELYRRRPKSPTAPEEAKPQLKGAQLIEDIQHAIIVDNPLKGARLIEEDKKDPQNPKQQD